MLDGLHSREIKERRESARAQTENARRVLQLSCRETHILRPPRHFPRLSAHSLPSSGLESSRDPFSEEELPDLSPRESLAQISKKTETSPHDGLASILVLDGELEEVDDSGNVGEEHAWLGVERMMDEGQQGLDEKRA